MCTWQWNVDGGMLSIPRPNLCQLACAGIAALLVSAYKQDVGIIIEDVMCAIAVMDVIIKDQHLHHVMQHTVSAVAMQHQMKVLALNMPTCQGLFQRMCVLASLCLGMLAAHAEGAAWLCMHNINKDTQGRPNGFCSRSKPACRSDVIEVCHKHIIDTHVQLLHSNKAGICCVQMSATFVIARKSTVSCGAPSVL